MKKLFIGGLIILSVLASVNAQTGATAAWEKDEKETFLGLTVFVRPQIMDIGSSVQSFFYDTNRGYTIEPPVKIARGKYSVRCVIGSEYTDEKVYLTFSFVRTAAADVLIQSVLLQNSTKPGQQMTVSSFEEIMYIMMTFFSAQ
jgi:hypothetical protein